MFSPLFSFILGLYLEWSPNIEILMEYLDAFEDLSDFSIWIFENRCWWNRLIYLSLKDYQRTVMKSLFWVFWVKIWKLHSILFSCHFASIFKDARNELYKLTDRERQWNWTISKFKQNSNRWHSNRRLLLYKPSSKQRKQLILAPSVPI